MRVFESFTAFAKAVDLINCTETLSAYGLAAPSVIGAFSKVQYQQLLEFCKDHPEFHIVSCVTSAILNKPVPTAFSYFLALGDADPRVYCIRPVSEIRHLP